MPKQKDLMTYRELSLKLLDIIENLASKGTPTYYGESKAIGTFISNDDWRTMSESLRDLKERFEI